MFEAYYCTILAYGLYTQYKSRHGWLAMSIGLMLEFPIATKIFNII